MSNDNQNQVQFEGESRVLYSRFEPSSKRPAIIEFILKTGIMENETQANYVLVGFVVVALAAAVYLYSSMGSGSPPEKSEMERIPLPGSQSL